MHVARALGSPLVLVALVLALVPTPPARADQRFAPGAVPPARFSDAERAHKLAAAFPEIDKIFAETKQG